MNFFEFLGVFPGLVRSGSGFGPVGSGFSPGLVRSSPGLVRVWSGFGPVNGFGSGLGLVIGFGSGLGLVCPGLVRSSPGLVRSSPIMYKVRVGPVQGSQPVRVSPVPFKIHGPDPCQTRA